MMKFRGLLVMIACFALVIDSTEAGWFRKAIRKVGREVKKIHKPFRSAVRIVRRIDKPFCKAVFGVGCPAGVAAGGAAVAAGSGGTAAAGAAVGVFAGTALCQVQKKRCKRSVDQSMADYVLVPFSHRFSDYDTNRDKQITNEEFVYSVMRSLPLRDPEHLPEPFMFADVNEDGLLDMDEFMGAPFMFADNDDIEITGSANRRT